MATNVSLDEYKETDEDEWSGVEFSTPKNTRRSTRGQVVNLCDTFQDANASSSSIVSWSPSIVQEESPVNPVDNSSFISAPWTPSPVLARAPSKDPLDSTLVPWSSSPDDSSLHFISNTVDWSADVQTTRKQIPPSPIMKTCSAPKKVLNFSSESQPESLQTSLREPCLQVQQNDLNTANTTNGELNPIFISYSYSISHISVTVYLQS